MSTKYKNLFLPLLVTAIVLIYTFTGGSIGISLDFGEDALTISAENYDHTIAYTDIRSITLSSLPDPGTMIDGIDKDDLRCGTWENAQTGRYIQYVTPKIDQCIHITLHSGETVVINYQDKESTLALYQMFTELLHSKGLAIQ